MMLKLTLINGDNNNNHKFNNNNNQVTNKHTGWLAINPVIDRSNFSTKKRLLPTDSSESVRRRCSRIERSGS